MSMRDISAKIRTLRSAKATARLNAGVEFIARLKVGDLPKGDALPIAKVAAIQAAKSTATLIPYCHPLPIEYVGVDFAFAADWVDIHVEVKSIHRTGVEMEALTAASVAALTLYDMMKMITKDMTISEITLVDKKGGKSQLKAPQQKGFRAGILVLSDSVAAQRKGDAAGALIRERLESLDVTVERFEIMADEMEMIEQTARAWCDELKLDLVITTGGTGLGPRDVTPEALARVIERTLPGVEEAVRAHGQERTPYAMLSRGTAGQRGKTVLVALPGVAARRHRISRCPFSGASARAADDRRRSAW